MTASELQDLLVATLVRKAGGTRRRWRIAVGPVRLHDLATHPHCNWSIAIGRSPGSSGDRATPRQLAACSSDRGRRIASKVTRYSGPNPNTRLRRTHPSIDKEKTSGR